MNGFWADRIAETAAIICLAAAAVVAVSGNEYNADDSDLASLRPESVSIADSEAFARALTAARIMVDGNDEADAALQELKRAYPGRHEVWALSARYNESAGRSGDALRDYARIVHLEPDYLDERSQHYLGARIERLVERSFESLMLAKDRGVLDDGLKEELRVVYFLKRRLAGGCE